MSQQELLKRIVTTLDRLGIPAMLTGALASSIHGEPRSTQDIDLVVDITAVDVAALAVAFPDPEFDADRESMLEAVRTRGPFTIIDLTDGDRIDFWPLTGSPFDESRFARRIHIKWAGISLPVSSPEDTLLEKLRWAVHLGGSEKHITDARNIYELLRERLDTAYIDEWADRLGVREEWDRIRSAVP